MTVVMMRTGQAFRVKRIVLSREVGKRLADIGIHRGGKRHSDPQEPVRGADAGEDQAL